MQVCNSMVGSALETLGWDWAGQFCPPMHNWTDRTVLSPCRAPISGSEAYFSQLGQAILSTELTFANLLMDWSRTYRRWLQGHLCEVWGMKYDITYA